MKKSNKKGFTIVELVIVIAVIAILSAVLIPTFSNITKKAKESSAIQAATNATTSYLAENSANIESKQLLLIDTGDYVVYVDANNQKTAVADKTLSVTLTAINANGAVTTDNFKKVDNHYEKVAEAINAGTDNTDNGVTADTYYTITVAGTIATGYTYYGTFEGCDVYVK